MATSVIHLFPGDGDSPSAGSPVAERVRLVAAERSVELEAFRFGSAQGALSVTDQSKVLTEYNQQIERPPPPGFARSPV